MNLAEMMSSLLRGCDEIITEADLAERLAQSDREGRPLRVKLGVDPTAPMVTLGWAVVLRKLRDFQRAGHTGVLIIGDFTAMIGDPSGQSRTRPALTREEVERNVNAVRGQLFKILDPEKTEIRYNSEWLGRMNFADVIRLASRTTVARILERDDFQKRLQAEKPIALHEILYPLCQAYDSIAVKADVELGGTDQKFNLLFGRNLQEQFGIQPQIVVLLPLLVGLDGKQKMSQSLGNYIGITEDANSMFGKVMSIPDHLIGSWFRLCTDVPEEEISALEHEMGEGMLNPRDAKLRLAKEIVRLYHSMEDAVRAREYFIKTFSKRETPTDVLEAEIPVTSLREGKVLLARLIADLGLAKSGAEAKRLIQQGGVTLDEEVVKDPSCTFERSELVGKVLRVGKHKFRRLVGT